MRVDHDMLIAYALGGLSPAEARQVEAHLQTHPADAAEVRDYFEALAVLALSQKTEAMPEDAEANLLKRIRRESQKEARDPQLIILPKRPHWQALAGLAAAAAVVAFTWFGFLESAYQDLRADQRLQAAQARPGTVSEALLGDSGDPIGTLVRFTDNRLFVVLDEAPSQSQVYQGWEIAEGVPVSLGLYDGRVIEVRKPLAVGSVFGVTLEPPGGSPQPTTTPLVLHSL